MELKNWVKIKLTQNPSLRDSNEKLYYQYLKESDYDINSNVKQFLKDMECRKIKYIDSIARASRFVQENNPNLRGKTWKKRKKKSTKVSAEIIAEKQ